MDKVIEETKCEFYDNYECNAYYDIYPEPEDCQKDLCRTHEDCYYRQLKRLEQENERLKTCIEMQITDETKQYIQKTNFERKNYKLQQTLQEIREIAEKMYNTNDEDTERDLHIELQAKIKEVIGVEE